MQSYHDHFRKGHLFLKLMNKTTYTNRSKFKVEAACSRFMSTITRGIIILALCLWTVGAAADPFDRMAFQSFLVDGAQQPITGNKKLLFSIFDAESGGTRRWAEQQSVYVSSGNFSVMLGDGTWDTAAGSDRKSLGSIFQEGDCYIQLEIIENNANSILEPRLRLLPSAYSYRAQTADKLSFDTTSILEVNATGTTAKGTLKVIPASTLNGALEVTGASTLNGALEVTGASTLNGTLKVTGTSTLDGALEVTGASTLKGNLTVGDTNTQKNVTVHGNVEAISPSSFIGHGTTPIGGIIMWSNLNATAEPPGWAICNGQTKNGVTTPDLTGRFIVGAGTSALPASNPIKKPDGENYEVNVDKGGLNEVSLTVDQMPSHKHGGKTKKDGAHSHTGNDWWTVGIAGAARFVMGKQNKSGAATIYSQGSAHEHVLDMDNTGGNAAHENRPPYYALAYIMRVK